LVLEQIVRQCIDKGLVKGNRQIIDSTPIRANITLSSITGLVRGCRENVLKTIEKEDAGIAERLGLRDLANAEKVKIASTEEGLQKELEAAGQLLDSVTDELKAKRISPTRELQKDLGLLEKAVADREKGAKDKLLSPVDPDARQGKKTSTTWPGYKAHIVIEEDTGIITGVETTPANATDGSQLQPLLKKQEKAHSIKPKELTGDKAYDRGENLESLASNETIANISLSKQVNRNGAGYFTVDDFLYDPESVKLMCPAGHISTSCYSEILYNNKPGYAFQFKPSLCTAFTPSACFIILTISLALPGAASASTNAVLPTLIVSSPYSHPLLILKSKSVHPTSRSYLIFLPRFFSRFLRADLALVLKSRWYSSLCCLFLSLLPMDEG